MPRTHPPYPQEYRRRIIELAGAERSVNELAREFEPSASAIRYCVEQAASMKAGEATASPAMSAANSIVCGARTRGARKAREILAKAAAWCVSRTQCVSS